MTKEILRKEYKQKRAELTDDKKWVKSQNIQNLFVQSDIYKSSKCLMVYMPLGKETETDLIISRAFSDGKVVVIPVTDESTGRITPVVIDSGKNQSAWSLSGWDSMTSTNEFIRYEHNGKCNVVWLDGHAEPEIPERKILFNRSLQPKNLKINHREY